MIDQDRYDRFVAAALTGLLSQHGNAESRAMFVSLAEARNMEVEELAATMACEMAEATIEAIDRRTANKGQTQ